jgi:predicted nucleic acid-binding Zn ribbon protein
MTAPTDYGFESIIDRECVVCGAIIPSNHPRQKTCSKECRAKMTVARRAAYRKDSAAVVIPRESEGLRRCHQCRASLSIYNRGFYCYSCWSEFGTRERNRRGGDR